MRSELDFAALLAQDLGKKGRPFVDGVVQLLRQACGKHWVRRDIGGLTRFVRLSAQTLGGLWRLILAEEHSIYLFQSMLRQVRAEANLAMSEQTLPFSKVLQICMCTFDGDREPRRSGALEAHLTQYLASTVVARLDATMTTSFVRHASLSTCWLLELFDEIESGRPVYDVDPLFATNLGRSYWSLGALACTATEVLLVLGGGDEDDA